MDGNVFLNGAKPSVHEANPVVLSDFVIQMPRLVETAEGIDLEVTVPGEAEAGRTRPFVTTDFLGKAAIPDCAL